MTTVVKCVSDNSPVLLSLGALLLALLASPWVLEGSYWLYAQWERKKRFPDSEYIGVFLSNGQVYFGKLQSLTRNSLNLGYIFYLQSNTSGDSRAGDKSLYDAVDQKPVEGASLVKLGEELHGPEDLMLINRQHVVFIEHLGSHGQVAQAIETWKKVNH